MRYLHETFGKLSYFGLSHSTSCQIWLYKAEIYSKLVDLEVLFIIKILLLHCAAGAADCSWN